MNERDKDGSSAGPSDTAAAPAARPPSPWVWGTWPQAALVGLGLAVWTGAYSIGATYNLLVLTLWIGPMVLVQSRLRHKKRDDLALPLWRGRSWAHVVQSVNVALLWVLVGIAMAPAPVNIQFSSAGHLYVVLSLCAGAAVLAAGGIVPKRQVSILMNLAAIVASVWFAAQLGRVHTAPSAVVPLELPVEGSWYVFQGGSSVLYNHHYPSAAQRHALDLVAIDGRSTQDPGGAEGMRGFLAYGAPVRSPATGEVATVVDDLADQPPGSLDTDNPAGNYVTVDIGAGRFVLLAHLRRGSIVVEPGDVLGPGALIGEVGNSGSTSEPHLHIHVQDAPTLEDASRSWPVSFVDVMREGDDESRKVPRRDDRLVAGDS